MLKNRKHLVVSAGYWFNSAHTDKQDYSSAERLLAMENAYNHVEGALWHVYNRFPEVKAEIDRINGK